MSAAVTERKLHIKDIKINRIFFAGGNIEIKY